MAKKFRLLMGVLLFCLVLAGCGDPPPQEWLYENQKMGFQVMLPFWGEDKVTVETSEREAYGETIQTAKVMYHGEESDCNPITFEVMDQAVWEAIKAEGGPTGTQLGSSGEWVLIMETLQSNPYKEGSKDYEILQSLPEAIETVKTTLVFSELEDTKMRKAKEILSSMTLKEKVGQMFIARCPEENAVQKAEEYHLGGYILFARDFEGKTKEQVISDIQSYQSVSDIPMLIGVDEEGGTVNRVSRYPEFRAEPFQPPQELYEEGGFERIRSDTVEKSQLLESLGINVNFAPVCDVSEHPEDFIYDRTFGQDGEQTAVYVKTVVETMKEQGMLSVLKHFPGYGNNADTHTGIAYDDRPYETFQNSDFLPFQAGIDSGADMVLISHNIVNSMDSQYPASLSAAVHRILREELGFSGVIVTDDLVMEGIRTFTTDDQAAVLAVKAGNDLLCCTDFETQIPAVLKAVQNGEIPEEQIDESVLRILKMKL